MVDETDRTFDSFKEYLINTKELSHNSVSAYLRDLPDFQRFLEEKGIHSLSSASKSDASAWLLKLKRDGRSTATVNRKLASIRAYYKFMIETGVLSENPTKGIHSPRIERNEVEYLTLEEVDRLLAAPDDTEIGQRDLAILEMLYATGLRATELRFANIDDINLRMGFVSCSGAHGKARIIPLGRPARAALEKYIYDVRPHFRKKNDESARTSEDDGALFLNYYGERITRQALWKVIKGYAKKIGLEKDLTPQMIRNSFAVHMIQHGADLKSIQELLGHEDPTATQVYLSVTRNRIKDVYDTAHPRA